MNASPLHRTPLDQGEPAWLPRLQGFLHHWHSRLGRIGLLSAMTFGICVFSALTTFTIVTTFQGLDAYLTPVNLIIPVLTPMLITPPVAGPILTVLDYNRRLGERYRYLAEHDVLTGVLNRHGLFLGGPPPQAGQLVVVADLNEFKQVNDTHGHAAGDEMLKAVAHALRQRFGERARIGRTGGDEFVVITDGDTPQTPEQLAAPMPGGGLIGRVSLGYARLRSGDMADLETAIARADEAMYRAKRNEATARGRPEPRHRPPMVRAEDRGPSPSAEFRAGAPPFPPDDEPARPEAAG